MKIDPAMLKEINKSVDGFVKKNRDSIANARDIEKLQSLLSKMDKRLKKVEDTQEKIAKRVNLIQNKYIFELAGMVSDNRTRIAQLSKKK